jgi:formyl-CoA transferase
MTTAALDGVTVLEVANYISGPYAGMLLADLGAAVIKIERRPHGDPLRNWEEGGYNSTFCSVNRNKRGMTLDLRAPEGRSILGELVRRADVFIENLRPGAAAELGIDYEALRAENPRLVYCSISGFGSEGRYRDWPGYDTIGQAMGGLLGLLTDAEEPAPVGISLSDHITGLFAATGILAALWARERTGVGQKVETSLLQATVSFIQESAARYFATGVVPRRKTRLRPAQVYAFRADDALPFVIHLSSPPKFWEGLTEALGRPDLRADARFATRAARVRHYDELRSVLGERFAGRPRHEWLERLHAAGVPCAPVNTLEDVFNDPQVQALGMKIELPHPEKGPVRLSGSAVRLSGTPIRHRLAPPLLGEHTAEVLRSLGHDDQTIASLRQREII